MFCRNANLGASLRAALTTLITLGVASATQAATTPTLSRTAWVHNATSVRGASVTSPTTLNSPEQLSLDTQGNLYVANAFGNSIVVYNAAFVKQTARTIANLNCPFGVAVDPYGNIFVGDSGNNRVVEYSAGGTMQNILSTGLIDPTNLAVDSLDDIYAVNGNSRSLSVFQKNSALAQSYRVGQPVGSMIAVTMDGPTLLTSQSNAQFGNATAPIVQAWDADSLITGNIAMHQNTFLPPSAFVGGMSADASGTVWAIDQNHNTILHGTPAIGSDLTLLRSLAYSPGGIVVDSQRKLIFVSDRQFNKIHVYDFQGQHVTTFQ